MSHRKLKPSLIGCGVFIFNTLLLALLCLQTGACFLLLRNGYIPLPAKIINQWLQENPFEGLFAQGKAFQLNANGRIRIIQPRGISEELKESVLRAQYLDVFLKLRSQPIARICLHRGQLFQPKVFKKNGSARLILDKLGLDFVPKDKTFEIKSLQAHYGNLRLRAKASISHQSLQNLASNAGGEIDLLQTISAACEKAALYEPLINQSENSILSLNLCQDSHDEDALNFDVQFDSHIIKTSKIQAKEISFASRATLTSTGLTLDENISFEAKILEIPEQSLRFENNEGIIFAQDPKKLLKDKWPAAQLRTNSLKYNNYTLDNLAINIQPSSADKLRLTGVAESFHASLALDADLNLNDYSGRLIARGRFYPGVAHPLLTNPSLPVLSFSKNGIFEFRTKWEPGLKNFRSSIYAHLPKTELGGVSFDSLQILATHSPDQIELTRLSFDRGNQWTELYYLEDLNTNDYALSTRGHLIPKEYNSFMPAWWKNIFNHNFEFNPKSIVSGDCVVYGNSAKLSTDFYYGNFDTKAIHYRDVPVTNGSLTLRGRNRYTEIHNLQVSSGKHWLHGDIHFTGYRDAIEAPAATRYKLEGSLPLTSIRKIVTKEIAKNLIDFETDQALRLVLDAVQFREADYPQFKGQSYLKLKAQAPEPLVYNDLDLDFLNFELSAQQDQINLRKIEFGLADGIGTGRIDHFKDLAKKTPFVNLDLSLKGADYHKARIALYQFNETVSKELASDAHSTGSSKAKGVLDLKVHSIGPADDFKRHTGNGSFILKYNALATIQLLGPFSMILENTPLGFTSLQLNRMSSEYGIADGFLKFSPLIIDGNQARIEANGTLHLADQALDMIIGLNLVGNVSEKINPFKKITDAVNPLNYLMQFKLSGTLQAQEIRSIYDPRNFLPF